MLIAAVTRFPTRMVIFPSRCRSFAIVLREGPSASGSTAVLPHLWMRFGKSSNHRGWQIHSRLSFAPGDVRVKAYISSHWKAHTGLLPRYARKNWLGNATTQQNQPQFGIELTVEKKSLLTVGFCFRDDRFASDFFKITESAGQLSLKPSSLPATINSRACPLVAASASLKNRRTVRLW